MGLRKCILKLHHYNNVPAAHVDCATRQHSEHIGFAWCIYGNNQVFTYERTYEWKIYWSVLLNQNKW